MKNFKVHIINAKYTWFAIWLHLSGQRTPLAQIDVMFYFSL